MLKMMNILRQQVNTNHCYIKMAKILSITLILFLTTYQSRQYVQASGVFELELVELHRLDQLMGSKQTQAQRNADSRHQPIRLLICLKEAFTSQLDGPCTFGNATMTLAYDNETTSAKTLTTIKQEQQSATNITIEHDDQQQLASEARGSHLQSQNQIQFSQQHQQGSLLTNVVRILFTFRWTKSFTIILTAEQIGDNNNNDDEQQIIQQRRLNAHFMTAANSSSASGGPAPNRTVESNRQQVSFVDRHVLTENEVLPNLETNPNKHWTSRFSRSLKSSLIYRFRVFCSLNYYGDGCTTFCRARDDQFGHYNCSSTGQKVCLDGWQGPDCDRAKCRPGCNQQHGYCDKPDTCQCRPGWTGTRCDECITYPGCQNGYCLSPWQCICQRDWGGVLCDQDLNYCGTRAPCKNNATCQNVAPGRYKCDCPDGFTGLDCETGPTSGQAPTEPMSLSPILTAGCALNPCLNGGTCFVFNSQLVVVESNFAEQPTINSANLTELMNPDQPTTTITTSADLSGETGNLYRCQCPPAWTGDYCQWSSDMMSVATADHAHNSSAVPPPIISSDLLAESLAQNENKSADPVTILFDGGHPPSTTPTAHHLDMKHLISGVVVASVLGVFMAASLLAWCCLIALERNKFPFIQMNIIRCGTDQSGDQLPTTSTLRRMQEKIRNSLRLSSSSSRGRIKPETRLSIENVLRPPPSYEETTKQPEHTSSSPGPGKLASMATISKEQNKCNQEGNPKLVNRGAIEQEMAFKHAQKQQSQPMSKVISSQIQSELNIIGSQTDLHSNDKHDDHNRQAYIVNCPRHGPLYRDGSNNINNNNYKALGDFNGIKQVQEPTTTIEIEYKPQTVSPASRQQQQKYQQQYDSHDNNYNNKDTTIDILHVNNTAIARHKHSSQYHHQSQLQRQQQQHQRHLYQHGHSRDHDQVQSRNICPSLHKSAHDKALARQ